MLIIGTIFSLLKIVSDDGLVVDDDGVEAGCDDGVVAPIIPLLFPLPLPLLLIATRSFAGAKSHN